MTTKFLNMPVHIPPAQLKQMRKLQKNNLPMNFKVDLQGDPNETLKLTPTQIRKMQKMKGRGQKLLQMKMSKTQMKHNLNDMKKRGRGVFVEDFLEDLGEDLGGQDLYEDEGPKLVQRSQSDFLGSGMRKNMRKTMPFTKKQLTKSLAKRVSGKLYGGELDTDDLNTINRLIMTAVNNIETSLTGKIEALGNATDADDDTITEAINRSIMPELTKLDKKINSLSAKERALGINQKNEVADLLDRGLKTFERTAVDPRFVDVSKDMDEIEKIAKSAKSDQTDIDKRIQSFIKQLQTLQRDLAVQKAIQKTELGKKKKLPKGLKARSAQLEQEELDRALKKALKKGGLY